MNKFWERIRNISAVVGILTAGLVTWGGLSLLSKINDALNPKTMVSITCPLDTFSHEVTVVGERSRNGDQVELFVGPQDGSCAYYAQGAADTVALDRGAWATTARLGNPFGLTDSKPPPLDYDVIAVLRNTTRSAAVDPGKYPKCSVRFSDWISKQKGIEAVASCQINRKPELALACWNMPQITSPAPACCKFYAKGSYVCAPKCNPSSLNRVRSPVSVKWDSTAPMYVELYEDPPGRSVVGFPQKAARSVEGLELKAGIYEVKIRRNQGDQCMLSVWFEVVSS